MQKFKQIVIIIVMALGVSFVADSAVFGACRNTICVGEIQRLYMTSATSLYIATDGDESVLNCSSPANRYLTMSTDEPNFNRKYAMLLTAMSTKMRVGLRIIENSRNCSVSYIYMDQ